jgi:hypothetical protein
MVLVNNEISRELSDILTQMRTIVEKILIIEDEKYEAIKEMNRDGWSRFTQPFTHSLVNANGRI